MMEANPERGEVTILLDGRAYPMRPSYEAMLSIEGKSGSSLLSILSRHAQPDMGLTLTEMAIIVTEGIKAAGKDREDKFLMAVSQDKIGELIYRSGFVASLAPVEAFLLNAISGGMEADGKKKESLSE
jgi:hypothetical protein